MRVLDARRERVGTGTGAEGETSLLAPAGVGVTTVVAAGDAGTETSRWVEARGCGAPMGTCVWQVVSAISSCSGLFRKVGLTGSGDRVLVDLGVLVAVGV